MSALGVGMITLACVVGGALLGSVLQQVLPEHHLSEDSKDIVKVVSGLLATLSALVLGLLIASSKSSFDAVSDGVKDAAARVILVDRVLAQYGPDANEARTLVRSTLAGRVQAIFPDERVPGAEANALQGSVALETVQARIRALVPANDTQRHLQSRALQILGDLAQARWLGFERTETSTPLAFLVVLIAWLAAMFASFALFAPRNATAVVVLFVGALSVSAAVFLIEEMNQPLEGLIAVSGGPLRSALSLLGQ
jgi:hypothetical protein